MQIKKSSIHNNNADSCCRSWRRQLRFCVLVIGIVIVFLHLHYQQGGGLYQKDDMGLLQKKEKNNSHQASESSPDEIMDGNNDKIIGVQEEKIISSGSNDQSKNDDVSSILAHEDKESSMIPSEDQSKDDQEEEEDTDDTQQHAQEMNEEADDTEVQERSSSKDQSEEEDVPVIVQEETKESSKITISSDQSEDQKDDDDILQQKKNNSNSSGIFRNEKGEIVEPVYFENHKGQIAKEARVRNPWARVDRIAILGERNSGTRWMTKELKRCFPQVSVKSELRRWKHWFQEDDGQEHLTTLVVAQFRDPYYWAEAMRHVPHHAPNHLYLSGDTEREEWKEFLTKPWTLGYRPERDLKLIREGRRNETGVCYENFNYYELESCVEGSAEDPEYQAMFDNVTGLNKFGYTREDPHDFKAAKPVYELRRDNELPFANIMEMRSAKIQNFLEIETWNWVKALVVVRYEDMLANGTESLIRQIENITTYRGATQLKRNCTPAPPQNRTRRVLDSKMREWITKNIDWETEGKIGYIPNNNGVE